MKANSDPIREAKREKCICVTGRYVVYVRG